MGEQLSCSPIFFYVNFGLNNRLRDFFLLDCARINKIYTLKLRQACVEL